MEIEPVYLSSKSCALLAQPTCFKRRSFNFGGGHSLFPVCGARFTVPLMLGQWSATVCRQFGVFPSDYGQPWQTANYQSNPKEVFSAAQHTSLRPTSPSNLPTSWRIQWWSETEFLAHKDHLQKQ